MTKVACSLLLSLSIFTGSLSHAGSWSRVTAEDVRGVGASVLLTGGVMAIGGFIATIAIATDIPTNLLQASDRLTLIEQGLVNADVQISDKGLREQTKKQLVEERKLIISRLNDFEINPNKTLSPTEMEALQTKLLKNMKRSRIAGWTALTVFLPGMTLMLASPFIVLSSDSIAERLRRVSYNDKAAMKELAAQGIDPEEMISKTLVAYRQKQRMIESVNH